LAIRPRPRWPGGSAPISRITEPEQAEDIIAKEQANLVMLAHKELDDPHFPYHAAKALGVANPQNVLPSQYAHWLKGR
jgi:2,4-dienoyl-CoA reductase-like NADH-dependent reductase (Old Yellow Enzyme family)